MFTKSVLAAIIISTGFGAIAQNQNYWKSIMDNNRAAALTQVEQAKASSSNIETKLSYELIRKETGKSNPESGFLSSITSEKDWEMYMYALWNESFFMGDYLSDGFSNRTVGNINTLMQKDIKYQALNEGVYYVKAITDRRANNLSGYKKYTDMMTPIREWQFCGAFENLNNSGIDAHYPPEDNAISTKPFNANSNGFINWYDAGYPQDAYVHFGNHAEYGSGVNYAQTFIQNDQEREVWLRLGASSKMRVYLNDVVIFEASKDLTTDLDAYNIKLNLPAGNNRLLIKLAEPGGSVYFIARITDDKGMAIEDLEYTRDYSAYNESTLEELNPVVANTVVEDFFIAKQKADPENFLNSYCLIKTYLRNEKYEQAKEIAEIWYEKYPKSSLMRLIMMDIYGYEDDSESIEELIENMEIDDEKYYVSYVSKFSDIQELFRMSYSDMEEFLDEFAGMMDNATITNSCGLLKAIRLENRDDQRRYLDRIVAAAQADGDIESLMTYVPLYASLLEDEAKSTKYYKKLNKKYFDYSLRMKMVGYYNDRNQRSKVLDIFKEVYEYADDFGALRTLTSVYQEYGMFYESKQYAEKMLEIYPYSFVAMEKLGDVYLQTGDQDKAIELYNKSLEHNSGNSSLRRKIRDITNQPDIVEDYIVEDIYAFVKEERGKIEENNYGYNMLLDQAVIQLYPEAGGKRRYTYVYEVTSTQGVERLTEYNLGIYSSFDVIKSEIIKKNGSIVPADANYSNFVFNGLEIGDVIHIDYETYFNGYGRFYKDFVKTLQIDSYHPMVKSTFTILIPDGIDIDFKLMNGEVASTTSQIDGYTVHRWEVSDKKGMPSYESYMPEEVDHFRYLHMSTIDSWSDIAFWYSDLVRSQLETTSEVTKVFKELFPESDLSSLSDNDKARRIYSYLMDNFNYSHVSFRQSGYVPQTPGKTIKTKLGDCKDFSTLFVALAQMADLEANLVLVLTGDYGKQALILPSKDFNHCIVKVNLDGEERYLELTDKNLPYKSLPSSLTNAIVLNIPYKYEKGEKYDLEVLETPVRRENVHKYNVDLKVDDGEKIATVDAEIYGAFRSYYRSQLDDPNAEMIKEKVEEIYDDVLGDNMKIDSVYNINIDREPDSLAYSTAMSSEEKVKKIGGIKIIELPTISDAYTGSIIEDEERKYPINYTSYESVDRYITNYTVTVPEGQAFTDLPENVTLEYKGHKYERTYKKLSANKLQVTVVATPGKGDISTEEYEAFKDFVTDVLEAKEAFIGYK
ncbi:MAG: DUF3857 domain-containing protein [Crocinitomicaceae bacterium]